MWGKVWVDMYVNCGMLEKAQKVRNEILLRTLYSLNHSLLGMLNTERFQSNEQFPEDAK